MKERVQDAQYVLELVNGDTTSGGGEEGQQDPPAKFTTAPPNGGIGCNGYRTHGKATDDSAAIFTINTDSKVGSKLDIVGGWATGHEAVTLTKKVTLVIGQDGTLLHQMYEQEQYIDDFLDDDEAEAELEEAFIEEEREVIENEIEEAEEDAVEALEEKRIETDTTDGLGSEINEVEEEIVGVLEVERKDVNEVLNSLEDEIISHQDRKEKEMDAKGQKHLHNRAQRHEAERKHREQHDRKHMNEDKLEEMYRRFDDKKQHNIMDDDVNIRKKDKLSDLMDIKSVLKENVQRLTKIDTAEHNRARHAHVKHLPKEELMVDMTELKQKAKERISQLSDKLGVHELLADPKVKEIHTKLKRGLIRGTGADGKTYNRDVGQPMPPEGRHFLVVIFSLFGLVGIVRYALEQRRKDAVRQHYRK